MGRDREETPLLLQALPYAVTPTFSFMSGLQTVLYCCPILFEKVCEEGLSQRAIRGVQLMYVPSGILRLTPLELSERASLRVMTPYTKPLLLMWCKLVLGPAKRSLMPDVRKGLYFWQSSKRALRLRESELVGEHRVAVARGPPLLADAEIYLALMGRGLSKRLKWMDSEELVALRWPIR